MAEKTVYVSDMKIVLVPRLLARKHLIYASCEHGKEGGFACYFHT